jgi:hypothetical protein
MCLSESGKEKKVTRDKMEYHRLSIPTTLVNVLYKGSFFGGPFAAHNLDWVVIALDTSSLDSRALLYSGK